MHEEDIKEIKEKLDKVLKILNGNGEIGLCAKVQLMWDRTDKVIATIAGILCVLVGQLFWFVISKKIGA